jgi:hypothetical protein
VDEQYLEIKRQQAARHGKVFDSKPFRVNMAVPKFYQPRKARKPNRKEARSSGRRRQGSVRH